MPEATETETETAAAASPSAKSKETAQALRIKELEAALKGYTDKEDAAEAERLRKEGEFDQLLATERGKHTKAMKELARERDEFKGQLDAIANRERAAKFTDAVAKAAGIEKSARLEALLILAKERHGLDIAPEDLDKEIVEGAIKQMKELDPETFVKKAGAKPLPAGQSYPQVGQKEDLHDKWRKIAEAGPAGLPRR